ncbi:MAG: flagellar protein FliS [Holosporales bacterium]|jgi:flagellin-specific chaperone FliS
MMQNQPLQKSNSAYLTEQEIGRLFDKTMAALKDTVYYSIVENIPARDAALETSRTLLGYLAKSVETETDIPEAKNMHNLLQFLTYSLEGIKKRNNPAAAQEALALLAPIRDTYLAMG